MMIPIFQITGDPSRYYQNDFIIEGEKYRSYLCSDAVREHLEKQGEDVKLVIFVPESFLTDITLQEFCDLLEERVTDFEPAVLPAIGTFRNWKFEGNVEGVITSIFLYILNQKPDKFYIDISTGFNLYPVSLLEAAKRYLTYRKLENILQEEYKVKAFKIFSPIIGEGSHVVEIQDLDVKAFFSLPNADVDTLVKRDKSSEKVSLRIGEINKEYNLVKSRFRSLYKELTMAFNAIRFNTPLAFFDLIEMSAEVDEIERGVSEFVKTLLEPVENTVKKRARLPVDGVNVANAFYSLALYRSIQKFAKNLGDPEIDEIYENFRKVYSKKNLGIGVNEYFLGRDVEDIKMTVSRALKNRKISEEEEKLYANLYSHQKCEVRIDENRSYGSSNIKRNFFAHSGFLREYTLIKFVGGKIYVQWLEDAKKEIKRWLESPEK